MDGTGHEDQSAPDRPNFPYLALMRNAGILQTRREGVNVYYRVASPKVIQACRLMRDVLMDHHIRRERMFRSTRN